MMYSRVARIVHVHGMDRPGWSDGGCKPDVSFPAERSVKNGMHLAPQPQQHPQAYSLLPCSLQTFFSAPPTSPLKK